METKFALAPFVVYGTITRNIGDDTQLVFQIFEQDFQFPLTWNVLQVFLEDEGLKSHCIQRAKEQSEGVHQFVLKLAQIQGLSWAGITSGSLLIKGCPERLDEIAEEVRTAWTEVFGVFDFERVPHNELKEIHHLLSMAEVESWAKPPEAEHTKP